MTDVLDEDIVTEEFSTDVSSPTASAPQTQEFQFGSVNVSEPGVETVDDEESSVVNESEVASPSTPSPFTAALSASDDVVSLDNLRAVSAMFDKNCVTFSQIVEGTGLSGSVVTACLTWLKNNGLAPLIAQNGSFYCSMDSVSILQKQFKQCAACYSGKV
jgi:hypothetical protein